MSSEDLLSEEQDISDVLDAEPLVEGTSLNLAEMDLPDLELDVTPKAGNGDTLEPSNE
jgi:hypothetical protein